MATDPETTGDLRTLVEECESFKRCEECGTHVVNLDTHRCPSPDDDAETHLSARQARAARDARDDDDRVGVYRRTVGNTYAYHELDDGEVRCGCNEYTKATRFEVLSRAEAKTLGRSPCGNCERLGAPRSSD